MNAVLLQSGTEGGAASSPDALALLGIIAFAALCGAFAWMMAGSSSTGSRKRKRPREQFCNDCGFGMDGGKNFCPRCGYPTDSGMDEKRMCTNCSTINEVEASFCGGCGDSI
jgi:RNA polymerase subunit RPABC4/transcription elongation factor Spt4